MAQSELPYLGVDHLLDGLAACGLHVANGHELHVGLRQKAAQVVGAPIADADTAHDDPLTRGRAAVGAEGGRGDDVGSRDSRPRRLQKCPPRRARGGAHRITSWHRKVDRESSSASRKALKAARTALPDTGGVNAFSACGCYHSNCCARAKQQPRENGPFHFGSTVLTEQSCTMPTLCRPWKMPENSSVPTVG